MPGGALEDGTSPLQAGLLPWSAWSTGAAVVWPLGPLGGAGGTPRVTVFKKLRPEGPERQPGPGSECLTGSKGGVHCVYLCV